MGYLNADVAALAALIWISIAAAALAVRELRARRAGRF